MALKVSAKVAAMESSTVTLRVLICLWQFIECSV
jgi:hypothetical protein